MAKDKTNDMTVGNPVSLIIRFMKYFSAVL